MPYKVLVQNKKGKCMWVDQVQPGQTRITPGKLVNRNGLDYVITDKGTVRVKRNN